jgi:hypothetical protein
VVRGRNHRAPRGGTWCWKSSSRAADGVWATSWIRYQRNGRMGRTGRSSTFKPATLGQNPQRGQTRAKDGTKTGPTIRRFAPPPGGEPAVRTPTTRWYELESTPGTEGLRSPTANGPQTPSSRPPMERPRATTVPPRGHLERKRSSAGRRRSTRYGPDRKSASIPRPSDPPNQRGPIRNERVTSGPATTS